ncbi:MAG TPA: MFS transporter [Solirubrobacteraceae bacterium]
MDGPSEAVPQPQASATHPRRGLLLLAVASGTVLNPLNSALIAVALIDIGRDLRVSFGSVSWLVSSFYLGSAIGQPIMGRLGDLYGRRRLFTAGLVTVGAASAVAPLAPTLGWLVGVRIVQALGSSALFPAGIGLLRHALHGRETRALGVLAISSSISASVGPTIGALLVGWQGWRIVFLVNVPIVLVALVLAARALPPDAALARPARRGWLELARTLDVRGALAFAAALFCLLWFLLSLVRTPAWWALAAALATAPVFVRWELAAPAPFIDLRTLSANRRLPAVYAQFAAVNVVFYSIFFGIPSYLQAARHFSVEKTGLIMLVITGIGVLTTPAVARLIERAGYRPPLLVGAGFMTAGTLLLLTVGTTTSTPWLVFVLAIIGVSTAFNNLGLQASMYDAAPREHISAASGLFMTSRYLGTILSASLLGAVFGRTIDTGRLHAVALVLVGLAALILVTTMRQRT